MILRRTKDIPNDLVKQISKRKCVLFVGAGFSASANLPGWRDLLLNMLEYCEKSDIEITNLSEIQKKIDEELYLDAEDMIFNCMQKDDSTNFNSFIRNEINKRDVRPTETHKILMNLPIEVFLTTNYDNLIERSYNERNEYDIDSFSLYDEFQLVQKNIRTAKGFVLHIHGKIEAPDKIIIGKKNYRKLMGRKGCNMIYQQLIASNTILFVGFGLNDPNFLAQIDKLKNIFGASNCNHYVLMSYESAKKWMSRDKDSLKKFSIIPYPEDKRDEYIGQFLEGLQKKVELFEAKTERNGTKLGQIWDPNQLNIAHGDARFYSIGRFEPKTPIELFKEYEGEEQTLKRSKLLQRIAEISGKDNFLDQIDIVQESGFADLYSNSWLDYELQIIGVHILYKLFKNFREEMKKEEFELKLMYDFGCSNWSQYTALRALNVWNPLNISDSFRYQAQDFNPQWRSCMPKKNCKFIQKSLPDFDKSLENKCDVVCCTHAFHYLAKNPLAIYSSFFSFNRLLKLNGYCYITVPEKNSLPGMPDLLDKAARDAGFKIKDMGKKRLVHRLDKVSQNIEPHNVTTFYYLILKKAFTVDNEESNLLIGSSLYKGKDRENAKNYGITKENFRRHKTRLEVSIEKMISEENIYIRIFTYAFDLVLHEKKKNGETVHEEKEIDNKNKRKSNEIVEDYVIKIQSLIMNLDKSRVDSLETKCKLQNVCSEYFGWLLTYLIEIDYKDFRITKEVIDNLNSAKDTRVDTNELNGEQIARLAKHLIELCLYEKIDILRKIEYTFIDNENTELQYYIQYPD